MNLGPANSLRFAVSYRLRRGWRALQDLAPSPSLARARQATPLEVLLLEHRTPIARRLRGVDPRLFENKRTNLRLAIEALDGLLIAPGELFSFWRLVGPPTASRGFLPGLVIERGEAASGVGGGLCQVSNALFWLALHSDLRVLERHRHSFDLFPDDARLVPFGTGATLLYNYKDLRLANPTRLTYQLRLSLDAQELVSSLRVSARPPRSFVVHEKNHRFEARDGGCHRVNEIWRRELDGAGEEVGETFLFANDCRCQYEPGEIA